MQRRIIKSWIYKFGFWGLMIGLPAIILLVNMFWLHWDDLLIQFIALLMFFAGPYLFSEYFCSDDDSFALKGYTQKELDDYFGEGKVHSELPEDLQGCSTKGEGRWCLGCLGTIFFIIGIVYLGGKAEEEHQKSVMRGMRAITEQQEEAAKRRAKEAEEEKQKTLQLKSTKTKTTYTAQDAYSEGYDQGYEQGMLDAHSGGGFGNDYDDTPYNDDRFASKYAAGYKEGYDEGWNDGESESDDE